MTDDPPTNPHRCRAGVLNDPRPDDPYFAAVEDALMAALDLSTRQWGSILGIWSVDGGALLAIVYQGDAFWP